MVVGSFDMNFAARFVLRTFTHDGEQLLDDLDECPRSVRFAGPEVFARQADIVEQTQRNEDKRRQSEVGDVVLLLVEVAEKRVVGRAEQVAAEVLEDPLAVAVGVFALEIERFKGAGGQDPPFQMGWNVHENLFEVGVLPTESTAGCLF